MSDISRTFEELGRDIAGRRQKKGLSLADVSGKTKIRIPFLQAIENGAIDKLPGALYARGFVRTYLELIGSSDLWPEYEACLKGVSPQKSNESVVHYFPTQKGFQKVSSLWIFALLFFAIGISLYMIWQQKDVLTVQMGTAPDVAQKITAEAPYETGDKLPETPDDPPAEPEVQIQAAEESSDPVDTVAKPPDTLWIPGQDESALKNVSVSREAILSIKSSGQCWIRISSDDGKTLQRTLSRGEMFDTEIKTRTSVRFGNAGAVTLIWGGKEIKSIGRAGEVVTLMFLPDGILKRL
ncbi:MAG: DUF4115 domain-containing protein [Thermovirgaceae bacterium]|nr:DUF4115 domain-containing protein [Thermovirgaceae bacterium]